MGMMNFEVAHTLPKEDARARMEKLTQYWGSKYGVKSHWNGDEATLSGKVMGITLDAKLHVTQEKVGGEGSDPGMLLRGQAKKYLTHKMSSFLDPRKKLEDLATEKD